MMASNKDQRNGPIDNGRGYLVNLVTLFLVGSLLAGNLLALGLTMSPVLGNAGRTYKASTSGEMMLPFYPDGSTICTLEAPSSMEEGLPFNVTLSFGSGERPHPLQFIIIRSDLGEQRFRLWDSWTDDGAWNGWTRVPGLEGGANWTVEAWSGWSLDRPLKLTPSVKIEVMKGKISFLLPVTVDPLFSYHGLMFREVKREAVGRYHLTYILNDRIKGSYPLVPYGNGTFILQENASIDGHWTEFDIECRGEPFFSLLPRVRYQKGFLLRTETGAPYSVDNTSFTLDTVLDHKDSLYEIETGTSMNESSCDLTLMSGTYYFAILTCGIAGADHPWYPLPDLTIQIEGGRYPLYPTAQKGVWKGVLLTPQDHGRDGRTDLRVAGHFDGTDTTTLLSYRTYLSDCPSPDLILSPDPFSLPNDNDLSTMELTLRGEWELVNWRTFRNVPTVELGGRGLELVEVIDGYEYNTTVPSSHQGTIGERTLMVRSTTYFEPAETILLVLKLKGPVLIVWFAVIAAAIIMSCAFLFGRGLRPLLKGGSEHLERNIGSLLRDRDNDLIATSRTYIGALFFSLSVVILFNLMEQPTPVPDILSERVPIWIRMVTLANASVWEEIITRVLMIGVPLSVFALMKQGKGPALKALIGGHGSVSVPAAVLIVISAALFGLAHIGWGIWKIVPTFVMGLLFGYLYVKIGLHATIALHFLFDYSSFLAELTGQQGPYLWTVLFFFSLLVGGVFLADLISKAASWMEERTLPGIGPVRVPMFIFLAAHGAFALLFGALMLFNTEAAVLGILLLLVPLMDGIAFLVDRRSGGPVPKMLVYAASLITLPAAPLGMAWMIGKDH